MRQITEIGTRLDSLDYILDGFFLRVSEGDQPACFATVSNTNLATGVSVWHHGRAGQKWVKLTPNWRRFPRVAWETIVIRNATDSWRRGWYLQAMDTSVYVTLNAADDLPATPTIVYKKRVST